MRPKASWAGLICRTQDDTNLTTTTMMILKFVQSITLKTTQWHTRCSLRRNFSGTCTEHLDKIAHLINSLGFAQPNDESYFIQCRLHCCFHGNKHERRSRSTQHYVVAIKHLVPHANDTLRLIAQSCVLKQRAAMSCRSNCRSQFLLRKGTPAQRTASKLFSGQQLQ